MNKWLEQVFGADAVASGNVVRRSRASIDKESSMADVIQEARTRGYHVIETGDQVVIICNTGELKIHC